MTSHHLPECTYSPGQPGFGGIDSGISSTQPYLPPLPCICPALRACEQRAYQNGLWATQRWHHADAFAAGLAAAREAVEALPHPITFCGLETFDHARSHFLAAIDALREKP